MTAMDRHTRRDISRTIDSRLREGHSNSSAKFSTPGALYVRGPGLLRPSLDELRRTSRGACHRAGIRPTRWLAMTTMLGRLKIESEFQSRESAPLKPATSLADP